MKIGILPCQGACNVGVMSNKVALRYVNNDTINMVCPLGLPLGIESIIKMAKANDKHIALNGCPVRYSSKALESAGIMKYEEFTITEDFNIKKNKDFSDETNMELIEEKMGETIARLSDIERN